MYKHMDEYASDEPLKSILHHLHMRLRKQISKPFRYALDEYNALHLYYTKFQREFNKAFQNYLNDCTPRTQLTLMDVGTNISATAPNLFAVLKYTYQRHFMDISQGLAEFVVLVKLYLYYRSLLKSLQEQAEQRENTYQRRKQSSVYRNSAQQQHTESRQQREYSRATPPRPPQPRLPSIFKKISEIESSRNQSGHSHHSVKKAEENKTQDQEAPRQFYRETSRKRSDMQFSRRQVGKNDMDPIKESTDDVQSSRAPETANNASNSYQKDERPDPLGARQEGDGRPKDITNKTTDNQSNGNDRSPVANKEPIDSSKAPTDQEKYDNTLPNSQLDDNTKANENKEEKEVTLPTVPPNEPSNKEQGDNTLPTSQINENDKAQIKQEQNGNTLPTAQSNEKPNTPPTKGKSDVTLPAAQPKDNSKAPATQEQGDNTLPTVQSNDHFTAQTDQDHGNNVPPIAPTLQQQGNKPQPSAKSKENPKGPNVQKQEGKTLPTDAKPNEYDDLKRKYDKLLKEFDSQKVEINELTARLGTLSLQQSAKSSTNLEDLSKDIARQEIGRKFSSFYDSEWTDSYEGLQSIYRTDRDIILMLRGFLSSAYGFCQEAASSLLAKIKDSLKNTITHPEVTLEGHNESSKSQNGTLMENLLDRTAKKFLKLSGSSTVDGLCTIFRKHSIVKSLPSTDKESMKKILAFVDKAVELTWHMSIQDPPMVLKFARNGDKIDSNVYLFYEKDGDLIDICVWPALFMCENGNLILKGHVLPI